METVHELSGGEWLEGGSIYTTLQELYAAAFGQDSSSACVPRHNDRTSDTSR
jgi:hypothetical protein